MNFTAAGSLAPVLIAAGVMQRISAYRLHSEGLERESVFSLRCSCICFFAAAAALAAAAFLP